MRPDGRPLALARPLSVGLDVVTTANASALVKVGSSTALAGIKCEVMQPSDDRPGEGVVAVTVELPPLCSATTRPGRPSEAAAVLTAQLNALLAAPGVLDRSQLCIDSGKAAWAVYIDVYVLDDDGALHDVCTAAVVAALSTLRLPLVSVDEAGNVQAAADGDTAVAAAAALAAEEEQGAFALGRVPTSLTCAVHGNGRLIVDPTAEEQRLSGAVVTTVVDGAGCVLALLKPGGTVGTSAQQLRQCYEAALMRRGEVQEVLQAALQQRQS